ncbi:NAD-dependent epimerase/dehydratase family protein [Agromyces sp. NPDC056379]|uniref:NAD-dependent epimerase/dehydratase family protein n=1 Tax=unclassified Agromyces TaxID=2639701 RepID=UPI0035E0E95C
MRILVIGATGVLGAPAARTLAAAGHEVIGTSRGSAKLAALEAAGIRGVTVNLLDRATVDAALDAIRPDAVVHLATDLADLDYAGNANLRSVGTSNLVDAALSAGIWRVLAESVSWTDADPAVDSLERDLARLPHGVVLRFGLLYGARTWYAPDGAFTAQAATGIVEGITPITNWVHVDDAVAAVLPALDWPAGPVDLVDDEPAELIEWATVLARRAGYDGAVRATSRGPGRLADNSLARSRGWTPTRPSWRAGLGLA